ncbi:MAG: pbpC [Acidobacteria bacterium]|nr:pbpC [Acidobacteriota bacterium]
MKPGMWAVGGALAALLAVPLLLVLLDALFPFPEVRIRRSPATVVFDRNGDPMRILLPPDQKVRIPVTLDELPPELIRALLASEDRWFWRHPGVNPVAIARATLANVRAGRVVSGASTIPMQIARMAHPRSRSAGGKAIEAVRALQLSAHHSKRELLALYLNMAPYGSNLEGIGAASRVYFGKRPAQLSLGEIAFLTTLPRSPNRYDPLRDHATALRARDRVLRQLRDRGAFTTAEVIEAMRQPLPRERRKAPFVAPHFCDYAVRQTRGRVRIYTTLDPRLQRIAEQQVAARIASLRAYGIEQTAVVVIDTRTREVRAMVGSAGFFDAGRQGQVNGAVARRSPGSTLKPFLYAKAFDDGTLIPDTYVLDIPTDYTGYVAENYDGTYRGRVAARDALVQSLNAPAVRLLSQEGVGEFVSLLRRGGLSSLDRDPSRYGLPLILGGGDVRLLDLTNLYATLAEGGAHAPVRILMNAGMPPVERLFSGESVALTTAILTELKRPDMPRTWQLAREAPAVAWKTGTSYGHRDAWSVGYSSTYAIGVWAGNFDGHGQKGMSGSEFAAPLLFDLFRAIDGDGAEPRRFGPAPETIELCAVSHELPTEYCRDRIRAGYLPGRTRLHACTMHRPMFVDAATGERLVGDCIGARPHRVTIATVFPPELAAYWRAQNETFESPPPVAKDCGDPAADDPPRITSPDGNTPYRLRRDAPLQFQEILLSAQTADASRLFWFEDGVLVADGDPARRLFLQPKRGAHQLVVVDENGRSDTVTYRVE